jgi:hypothetical protein
MVPEIEPEVVENMRTWPHSGFSVDQSVYLPAGDRAGIERLVGYMTRCPFSLSRLVKVTRSGQVVYKAEKDACRAFPVEKGDRSNLPERPEGCCAQIGPVPFFHRTLDDVEAVVAMFSPEQLAELEQFVRHARLEKTRGKGESALDLPPLDLGRSLQPLGTREQWYDEMLEERV